MMQEIIPIYDSVDAAFDVLESLDSCVNNYRIADIGDPAQLQAYVHKQSRGCCGQHDSVAWVKFDGYERLCLIGCNYGH